MSAAAVLADAWKRHVAAPAAPARPVASPAAAAAGYAYTLARADDYDRPPCVLRGDSTQPCNDQGGTYVATRSDGRQQRLCSNHAARPLRPKAFHFQP